MEKLDRYVNKMQNVCTINAILESASLPKKVVKVVYLVLYALVMDCVESWTLQGIPCKAVRYSIKNAQPLVYADRVMVVLTAPYMALH